MLIYGVIYLMKTHSSPPGQWCSAETPIKRILVKR